MGFFQVHPIAPKPRRLPGSVRSVLTTLLFVLALAANTVGASAARGATPNAPPAGSIGIGLVDVPVAAANDPRAKLYIVDHLAPGAVIHRRIEVANSTAATVGVKLYAAAATIAGGSFVGGDGHAVNDLATWTSVSPAAPRIAAGHTVIATVTIAVPANATPTEQYAVVWAEVGVGAATGQVAEVNRVGVRMYVSVGSGAALAANFTIESLTARRTPQGQPVVIAAVHNVGGQALDMSGTLELLSGPGGLTAGPFPATLGVTLAIADTEPVTITLDKAVPAGPWNARLTLRSGLIQRTATATITFPSSGASVTIKTKTPPSSSLYRGEIAGAIILTLFALAATVAIVVGRRRPGRHLISSKSPRAKPAHGPAANMRMRTSSNRGGP